MSGLSSSVYKGDPEEIGGYQVGQNPDEYHYDDEYFCDYLLIETRTSEAHSLARELDSYRPK